MPVPPFEVKTMVPGPRCPPLACAPTVPALWGPTQPLVAERTAAPDTVACQVRACPPVSLTVSVTLAPLHGSTTLAGLTAR